MKEKLAIFVDTEITSGGAYQELLYMIDRIVEFNHDNLEIVIISIFPNSKLKFIDKRYKVYNLSMNSFDRYSAFLRNHNPTRMIQKTIHSKNKIKVTLVFKTKKTRTPVW